MPFASRKRSTTGWPFWLLIVAWFCANTPPAAVGELASWLGNARHFTHQERLRAEVAGFLTGKKEIPRVATARSAPAKPFLPVAPTDATLKKIELAIHRTSELLPPAVRNLVRAEGTPLIPETLRDRPPHEPPRARLISC